MDVELLLLGQLVDEREPLVQVHPDVGLGHPPPQYGGVCRGDNSPVDDLGLSQPFIRLTLKNFQNMKWYNSRCLLISHSERPIFPRRLDFYSILASPHYKT